MIDVFVSGLPPGVLLIVAAIPAVLLPHRLSQAVMMALPIEQREIEKLPRAYIANVIYTVVGQPFKEWVDGVIAMRNDKIVAE